MKWIDFGKTAKTESPLKHDIPWVSGSSEEGLLTGLRNLIEVFSSLANPTKSSDHQAAITEQASASNENQEVRIEKPLTSNDERIVNRTRKKNFFLDMVKICSRTLSKPNN